MVPTHREMGQAGPGMLRRQKVGDEGGKKLVCIPREGEGELQVLQDRSQDIQRITKGTEDDLIICQLKILSKDNYHISQLLTFISGLYCFLWCR